MILGYKKKQNLVSTVTTSHTASYTATHPRFRTCFQLKENVKKQKAALVLSLKSIPTKSNK